ncbi:Putative calcium-dependent channel, 7TM region phosphate [Septoria linicola]|uniref:Calcium-dependent channel, 7TM region phosphate n=1 Tax=Septoria linicola TaxID=215465 RepID=A0A9Q9ELT3_9PEZI|nr:putative calcium-dependent channel, 7TM region phosphate [Septoria linicola]USW55380.1 Putative calcium-dependent channel, 7TM region phosphate [Septoria linicola]
MASPIEKRAATDEFLKALSDPFASALLAESALASLVTSIVLTIVLGLLFCFLRPYNNVVYATRAKYADSKHQPPPINKGLLGWVKPVIQTKEQELVRTVGIDAAVFMRVCRMLRNIFTALAVIGCGIIIPVNLRVSANFKDVNFLQRMTPQYLTGQQTNWAFIVVAWLFDIVICYFLWRNYRAITSMRRQYFDSEDYQRSLHARTLLLTDIPKEMRSDEGIARITDQVKATPDMPKTSIARNVKDLPDLVESHEKCVRQLEEHLAKYLRNPDRLPAKRPTCKPHKEDKSVGSYPPGSKVDAIEYLTGRIKELEIEIKEVRQSVDRRNAMSYGFASYEQISSAHSVAYAARGKTHQGSIIQLAPKPNVIIWKNLKMLRSQRKWRDFVNGMWIVLLTLVWVVPNVFIAVFLSNLNNLGKVWPAFQTNLIAHRTWWAIVQGVAAPALTMAFYFYLPAIFRRLCIKAGDTTKTSRERHVFRNLYSFFMFNNLIVFSIFSSLWSWIADLIRGRPFAQTNVFQQVFFGLCGVSPYWIAWMLQRNLGAAVDLSQLWTLVWRAYAKKFLSPTPRSMIELSAPQAFDYAGYYNYFLFYSSVALTFSTIQPLVLVVTALYFWMDSYMKKYLVLYVFITKYESGGMFWRSLFNRIVFATFFSNLIVALVVGSQGYLLGNWPMLAALAPLPLLLLGFKFYCKKTFDKQIHYYTTGQGLHANEAAMVDGKKRKGDRVGVRFGHPVLYKPLITPMVSSTSRHLLKQIYKGRTSVDESATAGGYSDVYMDSMNSQKPGKKIQDRNSLGWEMVDENNMDFEHYKNRPEFRDEAGGDGELYGRAGDMIRPGTPSSIATGLTRAGTWDSEYGHSREASGNSDYHDRSGSQSRETSRTRVAETGYTMPAGYHQTPSNLRGESPMGRPFGDRSRQQSRDGLVQHSAQMGLSTPGDMGGYGQIRYGNVPGDTPGYDPNEEDTSYDYFRRGRTGNR